MRISLGERVAPALALGLAAAFAPALAESAFGHARVSVTAHVHFYAVGMTALVAAAAAVALTLMGARLGDTRTVLIGTAFAPSEYETGISDRRETRVPRRIPSSPTAVPASVWR